MNAAEGQQEPHTRLGVQLMNKKIKLEAFDVRNCYIGFLSEYNENCWSRNSNYMAGCRECDFKHRYKHNGEKDAEKH